MPFVAGKSGNPNGRPHVVRDFRERCRKFMDDEGWDNLAEMARDKKHRDRFRSNELLAAYGYGRPTQPIAAEADSDAPPLRITVTFDKPDADEDSRGPAQDSSD